MSDGQTEYQPRWRLDIDDDGTIDRATQTITKIQTGESCYRSFAFGTAVPVRQQQPRAADRKVATPIRTSRVSLP